MAYSVTNVNNIQDAYKSVKEYEYALVYMMSEIKLCETSKITDDFMWEECLEARFFSKEKELHVFDGEDGKKAVIILETDAENRQIKKYELNDKIAPCGKKKLLVTEYLAYDEDGQAYVELTRLSGLE